VSIGDTLADPESPVALPRIKVDEPTMMMVFRVNDGPLAGREGKYVTSRNLRERLYREAYRNVSIRVEDTETPDAFRVVGRGELQLAVIIETMRREGYELTASNPEPLTQREWTGRSRADGADGLRRPEASVGAVTERLGPRKGRMTDMSALGSGRTRLTFRIPARGLVGFRSEFLTITRGEGIMSSAVRRLRAVVRLHPQARATGPSSPIARGHRAVRAVLHPGARHALRRRRSPGLRGNDHRRERPPSDLNVNACREKKLHQHPGRGPRRERHPHHAAGDVAGAGAGVDRPRRAGGGHPEVGADAQRVSRHRRALQADAERKRDQLASGE
jgi:GTP-binding protein